MKNIVLLCLALLSFAPPALGETKPKYGPAGMPRAQPLGASHDYFQSAKNPAPDFWAMIGYYVPQMNPYSCSAAAVAMTLNAAKFGQPKTSDDKVILQAELLDKVKSDHWKARLSEPGHQGKHGVELDRLGRVVKAAFHAYGFPRASVKVVHVDRADAAAKKELLRVLTQNESSKKDFVIANFNQQVFTDDADAGHVAPIGAFDAKAGRVLVFDPDRDYYEPYWISVDTLLAGMATLDKGAGAHRGYVVIETGE